MLVRPSLNSVSGQFSNLQTAEPIGRGRDLGKPRLLTLICESPVVTDWPRGVQPECVEHRSFLDPN